MPYPYGPEPSTIITGLPERGRCGLRIPCRRLNKIGVSASNSAAQVTILYGVKPRVAVAPERRIRAASV